MKQDNSVERQGRGGEGRRKGRRIKNEEEERNRKGRKQGNSGKGEGKRRGRKDGGRMEGLTTRRRIEKEGGGNRITAGGERRG